MARNYKKFWNDKHDPIYANRQERNEFLAKFVKDEFSETQSIINIGGGGKRHLQSALEGQGVENKKVTEIDMVGDCDHILNLDQIEALPFGDQESDLCIATDILEHLENFHLMAEELIRVAKKAVIISLPVPTNSITHILFNEREDDPAQRGIYDKFYGLPLEKPEDRHRWWYTIEDVERLFVHFADKHGLKLTLFTTRRAYNVRGFKGKILRAILGPRLYRDIRYPYIWIVLNK